jgi:hypothetical protein
MRVVKSIITLLGWIVMYNAVAQGLIIDHRCTNISGIPNAAIEDVKRKFRIAYGHTSHGSQIISGMQALAKDNSLYNFNRTGSKTALSLWDRMPSGDLGNPNRYSWADRTRKLLRSTAGRTRNLMIWSWCGQVSNASDNDIKLYLELMTQLEKQFPDVTFVYMTGHLDGSGVHGNLHVRNQQIREFCRKNNKVLYDFADIESYDPDGQMFIQLYARDNCDYRVSSKKYNWAAQWLKQHPVNDYVLPASAAHTHVLNGAMKANAFWWMLVRLAGWKPKDRSSGMTTAVADIIEPFGQAVIKGEKIKTEKPAKVKSSTGVKFSRLWRFNKISDYRDWKESGSDVSLIPEKGAGLLIPAQGTPAVALLRKKLAVTELEFKATLLEGSHINWYLNSNWVENEWKIEDGVGGILNRSGCMLVVDGKVFKIPGSPRLDPKDRTPFHIQVTINNDKLIWGINGRVIAEAKLSPELIGQRGQIAIGAYKSKLLITGIYVRGTE